MTAAFDVLLDPARLGFDPETLRAKYRAERDRRIRDDGNAQYREVSGDFARFTHDPWAAPDTRAPVAREVDFVIVGGGFGGLLAAARLREAGFDDLLVVDKAGDFGGTWYWNRYPGAMCDIESYIYLPLLEEMNYVPTEKYTHALEMLAYSQAIGRRYGLYERALLQTGITRMRWHDEAGRWRVETDRGDTLMARFVVLASGPLNRPKLPGIAGIEDYTGHMFHTSRWDYAYTGGDSSGGLTGLADKRVAIIGTGATAIQCIPHLGEHSKHLYVFQRTPSSVDVRNNRPTDPEWVKTLTPGWQQRRMENFNTLVSGGYADEDLVNDGWTEIFRNLTGALPPEGFEELAREKLALATELADMRKMNQVRARVDAIVRDPVTAEALKPWYRQFCKRPCFHDEYLATYNRPNVTLFDTAGVGVERITPTGVVVAGREYPVDCLVFATGFEVGTSYNRRAGHDVTGRDGLRLADKWAEGPSTFHGLHSHGFPNVYFMGFVQSVISANAPHVLAEQARHIAWMMTAARARGVTVLEATAETEAGWVGLVERTARAGERFFAECTPGYYNNESKPDRKASFITNVYGGGPMAFFKLLADWREEGALAGLALR